MSTRAGGLTPLVSAQQQPVASPDMSGLDPEVQARLDAIFPQGSGPQMQQSPNGPFGLNGNMLDQASLGALQGFQNMTVGPRNAGQSIVGGFLQGLVSGRASQAISRSNANAEALKQAHADAIEKRRLAASLLAQGRQDMPVTDPAMATLLGIQPGGRVPNSVFTAALSHLNPTDPMVDVTTPEYDAFFKSVNYKRPPKTKMMKQSVVDALGRPSTAAGTAAPGSGVGTNRAYFWGTVQGKGGTVPYGLLRSFKGQDLADFTQGAQDASGGAGGMVGNAANVGALRGALSNITRTKAGFDALDILLDKSTNLLKSTLDKVPDTGTQFGNSFARYWNAQMGRTGTTNFNAVLGPVQTEASRVLTSGTLNGQAITDTARHDLQSLAGGNFTKQQMVNALDLLAQERGFRKQGFEQSIAGLKSQLGLPPDSTATPNAPVEGNATGKARLKARGIR
jgi:hypothetical protein